MRKVVVATRGAVVTREIVEPYDALISYAEGAKDKEGIKLLKRMQAKQRQKDEPLTVSKTSGEFSMLYSPLVWRVSGR